MPAECLELMADYFAAGEPDTRMHKPFIKSMHKLTPRTTVALHQAATPPFLSRGIRSAAVKMDEELYLLLNLALYLRRRRRRRHRRSVWVRSIFRRRRQQGEFHNLLQVMRLSDSESHFRYLRMTKERFDILLSKVLGKAVYFWT